MSDFYVADGPRCGAKCSSVSTGVSRSGSHSEAIETLILHIYTTIFVPSVSILHMSTPYLAYTCLNIGACATDADGKKK